MSTNQKERARTAANAMTPADLARIYSVNVHQVLAWINSGELRALNIAKTKKRPRWRIKPDAIADFERQRTPGAKPATKQRNRRPPAGSVIEFY